MLSVSVCLSVRLSVHDVQVPWSLSRPNSLRYLLTMTPTSAIWSNGNTPKIMVEYVWGLERKNLHWPRPMSETVQIAKNRTRLLRTNRKSHTGTRIRLVPKSITLDDPECPKRTFAEKIVYGAHQKMWMKIILPVSPSHVVSREKCRSLILVSRNIRFVRIMAGVF